MTDGWCSFDGRQTWGCFQRPRSPQDAMHSSREPAYSLQQVPGSQPKLAGHPYILSPFNWVCVLSISNACLHDVIRSYSKILILNWLVQYYLLSTTPAYSYNLICHYLDYLSPVTQVLRHFSKYIKHIPDSFGATTPFPSSFPVPNLHMSVHFLLKW